MRMLAAKRDETWTHTAMVSYHVNRLTTTLVNLFATEPREPESWETFHPYRQEELQVSQQRQQEAVVEAARAAKFLGELQILGNSRDIGDAIKAQHEQRKHTSGPS